MLAHFINGEKIINSIFMYLINLLPKRFRLSASSEVGVVGWCDGAG